MFHPSRLGRHLFSLSCLLLTTAPVWAQQKTMIMISSAACSSSSCTQEFQFCEQGSPGVLYRCNTGGGFYVATPTGDVAGPGSSIDNAIVRFDGTTGKIIQSYTSGAPTIGDTGVLQMVNDALLAGNDVDVVAQTGAVLPGASVILNMATGFDHVYLAGIEVESGCDSYTFGLYLRDTALPGDELLLVGGQQFDYRDGSPPVLRDADGTGEIHSRFTNSGNQPCTFRLIASGAGF